MSNIIVSNVSEDDRLAALEILKGAKREPRNGETFLTIGGEINSVKIMPEGVVKAVHAIVKECGQEGREPRFSMSADHITYQLPRATMLKLDSVLFEKQTEKKM